MSMHCIYIECANCQNQEAIYTGSLDSDEFYREDWEGETIIASKCVRCEEE